MHYVIARLSPSPEVQSLSCGVIAAYGRLAICLQGCSAFRSLLENLEVSNSDHPAFQLLSDHGGRDDIFFCLFQVL